MRSKYIIIVVVLFLIIVSANTQTLPDKLVAYTPDYIANPDNKWSKKFNSWQDYVLSRLNNNDFGKRGSIAWVVYSDRDDNTTYVSPSNTEEYSSLNFMEKVYIADIKNSYALVFTDEYIVQYPTVNETAETKGWIPIENLLLWEKCPKNQNTIFQKGLVVGDPTKGQHIVQNPPFKTSPSTLGNNNGNAYKLDILFIMKTVVDNGRPFYLLSKELTVKERTSEMKGWLSDDYITLWDQRLCLEPTTAAINFDFFRGLGVFPSVYKELDEAKNFFETDQQGQPFWIYREFSRERMDAYTMRAPILGRSTTETYKVASIASINAAEKSNGSNEREIEELKDMLKNINVIIVIDATSSMKNYYTPIANALENIKRLDWGGKDLNIGVVLYRNAADNEREIQVHRISNNIDAAINFISSNKDNVSSIGRTHYESLFKGLETALDTRIMGYSSMQSNFMIVIGDAGNQDYTRIDEIAQKMTQNRINLLAFQANHSGVRAYDDFASQIGQIINKKIQLKNLPDVKFVRTSNRLYVTQRSNSEIPSLIFSGYKFANPGRSEPVNVLRDDLISNINEFRKNIQDRIDFLASSGIIAPDGIDEIRLREILKDFGWIQSKIDSYIYELRNSGVTKLVGYSPVKLKNSNNNSLFDYVLFFSQDELKDIIKELKKLESNSNIGNRKAYQDAIISMGQAFLGQMSTDEIMGMSMDELTSQIYGVPVPISNCGIRIVDIINRKRISDSQLQDYINNFNTKRRRLENIANNSYNGKFKSNDIIYIWIPLMDMPGYCAE